MVFVKIVFVALTCLFLHHLIIRLRAAQAFPLIKIRRCHRTLRCPRSQAPLMCLAVGFAVYILIGPVAPTDLYIHLYVLAICLLLAGLIEATGIRLREHGIECALGFLPWNRITKFEWTEERDDCRRLTLWGSSALSRSFLVPEEQYAAVNGLVSGATRLEPASRFQQTAEVVVRCLIWSLVAAGLYTIMNG